MKKTWMAVIAAVLCLVTMLSAVAFADSASPADAPEVQAASGGAAESEADAAAGKRIYFAAPLFCQSEKDYNLKLVKVLEDHGYQVFLPQRDGFLAPDLEGLTEEELTKKIFDKDVSEVLKADIVFVLLDGRVPDEGACVELGIAAVELNLELNPMITGCLIKLFRDNDGDSLIAQLEQYLSENEL